MPEEGLRWLAAPRYSPIEEVVRLIDIAARVAGLTPVKVNAVLGRGVNDVEAPDLLAWCVEHDYELRFIEQMPLDAQRRWDRSALVTAEEILNRLTARFTLTPESGARRGSAPAERGLVDGGPARVGVISSVTRPFCRACDRTRLTADGQVRSCLFAGEETDLRGVLRSGAGDDEIVRLWRAATWGKKAGGEIGDPTFGQPERPMSAIGG
jgi:cyclic pyranopterin phosphate synthase